MFYFIIASSTQSFGAFTNGKEEFYVKCGKKTQKWKSRSDVNPGKIYNRCPIHIFSHWAEQDEEEEADSKETRENTTNLLLSRLLESNQALLEEQVTTNRLLREMIEGNQQNASLQAEENNMSKLLAALGIMNLARQNV